MPYLANRWHSAQLTNIHYWDGIGGAWSGNLIGAATPFAFLPNPAVTDDLVVFGIDSTVLDSGPFGSLVFDITQAVTGITTAAWKYSDVAGVDPKVWAAFAGAAIQDNTNQDGIGGGLPFDTLGVNSVSWQQNALWIVQNPTIGGVALGVTGYWVCMHVTLAAPGTPPLQGNRSIYTVNWPCADFPEPGGDLQTLPRIRFHEEDIEIKHRLICGLRKTARGADFRSYINLSQAQNPPGITVATAGGGGWQVDPRFPTGEVIRSTTPPALGQIEAVVTMDETIAPQYKGVYRAFLRGIQTGGAVNVIGVQLMQSIGDGLYNWATSLSDIVRVAFINDVQLFDMGRIDIPSAQDMPLTYGTLWYIFVYGDGVETIDLIDFILIPVDEWACDIIGTQPGERDDVRYKGMYFDVDSITYPKKAPFVGNYGEVNPLQIYDPTLIGGSGGFIPNVTQRIHMLTARIVNNVPQSWPRHLESFDSWQVQRYSSMRGAR